MAVWVAMCGQHFTGKHRAPRKERRCPLAREGREKGGRKSDSLGEDCLPTSGNEASVYAEVSHWVLPVRRMSVNVISHHHPQLLIKAGIGDHLLGTELGCGVPF